MCDTAVAVGEGVSEFFGGGGSDVADAADNIYNATDLAGPAADTVSGAVDLGKTASNAFGVAKDFATSPTGGALLKTGLTALTGAGGSGSGNNFNDQLASLMRSANNQSYNQAQVTPPALTPAPGLMGSRGAVNPAGTIASMNRAAPVTPTGTAGTQAAPSVPTDPRQQTGAVKLGVRPRMYG